MVGLPVPDGVVGVEEVGEAVPADEGDAFHQFRFVDAAVFDVFTDDVGGDTGGGEALHVFIQLGGLDRGTPPMVMPLASWPRTA